MLGLPWTQLDLHKALLYRYEICSYMHSISSLAAAAAEADGAVHS